MLPFRSRTESFRFHFCLDPRSQQTFQYSQMLISMIFDLGLDQNTPNMLAQTSQPGDLYSREAQRAYLGCFYISSVYVCA